MDQAYGYVILIDTDPTTPDDHHPPFTWTLIDSSTYQVLGAILGDRPDADVLPADLPEVLERHWEQVLGRKPTTPCAFCGESIIPNPSYEGVGQEPRLAAWIHGFVDQDTDESQDDYHEAIPAPTPFEGALKGAFVVVQQDDAWGNPQDLSIVGTFPSHEEAEAWKSEHLGDDGRSWVEELGSP